MNLLVMKKETKIWIYSLAILGVLLMLSSSCSKKSDSSNSTPTGSTIKDADGNIYHTVTIGTQVWMVENLKTTKYNDGTAIPLVTNSTAWGTLTTPGYCWYNNDSATYKTTYGALYNWYAVLTGKLCPSGWHVPIESDWNTLATYLGGVNVAGGKMKSTGTMGGGTGLWQAPNAGATNESGFTALPGGERNYGAFDYIEVCGNWWSSTTDIAGTTYYRVLTYDYNDLEFYADNINVFGFSVRCIKD
jgi:uncharacterized protein (TIGR02145 family)